MKKIAIFAAFLLTTGCTEQLALSDSDKTAAQSISISSKPSFIVCSTSKDTLPVSRVMYLSKFQDGNYFYEAIPKPKRESGHSEHFLIMFDRFDTIRIQLPRDPQVFPDCKIGTSISDLLSEGRAVKFVVE